MVNRTLQRVPEKLKDFSDKNTLKFINRASHGDWIFWMGAGRAALKQQAIGAGFTLFRATGAHRLASRITRGLGAILMFHHVRPWAGPSFAPNRLLEITPDYLAEVIETLKREGFDIVSLDEGLARLQSGGSANPFAVLTFDDGYRDNLLHALPVLKHYRAPFTLYVTTGFAEGTARLWWLELEQAVRGLPHIELALGGTNYIFDCRTAQEKADSFNRLYWLLRVQPEEEMLQSIHYLAQKADIDGQAITRSLCMNWDEILEIAADPLCAIGVHTLTHSMLAHRRIDFARHELFESRRIIEAKTGKPAPHLAWPVGDPASAGPREFALARELGFASAVTTRPGMLFPAHAGHLTALPRLSVNGNWQDVRYLEVLLTGAPFALWNRGRRVNVA